MKEVLKRVACVDLFCGAGGLTHGLARAGVPVVAGVDLDESCRHPYEANNPGAAFYARDITNLRPAQVRAWFGDAPFRILVGCAPCQPFSSYSNRYETRGTERWSLLNQFSRLVRRVRPEVVTMENVPTIRNHEVFERFVKYLRREGYHVWHEVVDCSDYGLPQVRRRIVLLASLFGEIELKVGHGSKKSVRDAIATLPPLRHGGSDAEDPLHRASRLSPTNLKRIRASRPGGSWREWPEHLRAACHSRETGSSYPAVYGRMSWDEPAPTLTTQFYGFGSGRFGHPDQNRALSLREGAILQGFPNDYSFVPAGSPVGFKVLGRLIGNAVPVELGRVIGQTILEHLERCAPASARKKRRQNDPDKETSTRHVA